MQAVKKLLAACIALSACTANGPGADRHADSASTTTNAGGGAVAGPTARETARSCGEPVIDGNGVAAVRIGIPVDSVRARCTVVRDSVELDGEGMPQRVVRVALANDTMLVEVDSARVWRIQVVRPGIVTRDSLGVGTPVARLLALPGVQGITGEGNLFVVTPARCGLSFQLSEPRTPAGTWSLARLRQLPPATVVKRVLVLGCRAR